MLDERYLDFVRKFDQSKLPHYKPKIFSEPRVAEMGRLVTVAGRKDWLEKHGDQTMIGDNGVAEARGACYCRLLFFNNKFYAFALSGNSYFVREFDLDWHYTGFEKGMTPHNIRDFDQDVTFDGKYIYQAAQGGKWCQLRQFDKEFNLIKKTPILKSGSNEFTLDLNVAVINGKIFLGTEYRENGDWRDGRPPGISNLPPNPELARGLHLRIFDTDLNLIEERDLTANIEGAVVPHQYWGMGASQLYADGYYCVVSHSPIGNINYFDHGESLGARQIFILRFDDDFNFVDSKGPLSDTNYDNFWCTGSWYEDGKYYIAYCVRRPGDGCMLGPGGGPPRPRRSGIQGQEAPRPGGPDPVRPRPRPQSRPETTNRSKELGFRGMGNIFLSIFDEKFKKFKIVTLTDATIGKGSAGNRPKILKIGKKIYVTYDTGSKSFVQELIMRG